MARLKQGIDKLSEERLNLEAKHHDNDDIDNFTTTAKERRLFKDPYYARQEAQGQGPWRSAWAEDLVHKNVLKTCE